MDIAGHRVEAVLVEERAAIATEYYAAVLNDAASKGPLVVFSPEGGMDIEEIAATKPDRLRKTRVDILRGFDLDSAHAMLGGLGLGADQGPVDRDPRRALPARIARTTPSCWKINPLARLRRTGGWSRSTASSLSTIPLSGVRRRSRAEGARNRSRRWRRGRGLSA